MATCCVDSGESPIKPSDFTPEPVRIRNLTLTIPSILEAQFKWLNLNRQALSEKMQNWSCARRRILRRLEFESHLDCGGIAGFHTQPSSPHNPHRRIASELWYVKVICTLCLKSSSSSSSFDVFKSDYFNTNLNQLLAFRVVERLSGNYYRNPNLAFDFFRFTRVNLSFVHSFETYDLLLRSLCYVGLHDSANLVLEYMRADGLLPSSSLLGFLVYYFAQLGCFSMAKGLLIRAQEDNVEISAFVYNNLLSKLMNVNQIDEAVRFFRDHILLKWQFYRPDTCTFNIIIRGLCKGFDAEKAFEFFNQMGVFNCLPDRITYNTLIHGFSKAGKTDKGLELLRVMQSGNGVPPDVITYASVITGYCKTGKMKVALEIFHEMTRYGVKPSLVTFNVLIDGFGKMGDMPSALNMYERMLFLGCQPDIVTFTSLIDGYCRTGQVDQGLRLWNEIEVRNLSPNVYTFAIVINALCKNNRIQEARNLLRQLRERKDIVPQPFIYNPVIDGYCKAGNVDEANAIVTEMEEKRCRPDKLTFTILIIGHAMKGRMSEAISIFSKMLALGCAPDKVTLRIFESLLLKAGMPKEAWSVKQAASEGFNMGMTSLREYAQPRTDVGVLVAV